MKVFYCLSGNIGTDGQKNSSLLICTKQRALQYALYILSTNHIVSRMNADVQQGKKDNISA